MADGGPQRPGFIAELRRRQVLRVVGFYAIAVWLTWQVADVILDPLNAPRWIMTALIVALALGFPIVAVLAWAFDFTPAGLVRTGAPGAADVPVENLDDLVSARPRVWADIVVIGVLLAIVAYFVVQPARHSTAPTPVASIAVLPFTNMSPDPDDAYLGDALAEDIIHHLAQMSDLQVAARTSSWSWRDHAADIPAIAKALGVRSVLEGSVQRERERIKVTVQLIDGETGYHMWSQTFSEPLQNVFRIKQEIANLTAGALGVVISGAAAEELARPLTENARAYEMYLRALELLQRPQTATTLDLASDAIAEALDLDPRFAAAHSTDCAISLARYRDTRDPGRFESAEKSCHRAITLAPSLPEAHHALGDLYRHSGLYDRAREQYEAVARMRPSADARIGLAWVHHATGAHEQAVAELHAAIRLAPTYWVAHYQFGRYEYIRDDYAAAIDHFRRASELTPGYPTALQGLSAAYFLAGDLEQAEAHLERAFAMDASSYNSWTLGLYRWLSSDNDGAIAAFEAVLEATPKDFRAWCQMGYLRTSSDQLSAGAEAYSTALRLVDAELAVNPNDAETHADVALCTARSGALDRAREHLESALRLAPDSASVQYMAAKVRFMLDDPEAARQHLDAAEAAGFSRVIIDADPELTHLTSRFD